MCLFLGSQLCSINLCACFYVDAMLFWWTSQVALVVKNLPAIAGDMRVMGSILESGRSPGRGQGNPLLYSWLENPMDRVAWQVTVHRVAKGWTWLKQLSTHTHAVLTTILCNIVWNRCDASSFVLSWNCFCYSGTIVVKHIFMFLLISLWKILFKCW